MEHITHTVSVKKGHYRHIYYHDSKKTSYLTSDIEFVLMSSVLSSLYKSREVREHIDANGVIRMIEYIIEVPN